MTRLPIWIRRGEPRRGRPQSQSWAQPGRQRRAVDRLVSALHTGQQAPIDAAIVTTAEGDARLVLAVVGFGFDSRVSVIADRISFPRGTARYIWSFARTLTRFSAIDYTIEIDGEVRKVRGMLADVANAETYGGGMRIAPGASMRDGVLDLMFLGEVGLPTLLGLFGKIFKGRHVEHEAVQIWRGKHFVLSAEGEQAWGDGEYIAHSPVTVRVAPSAITLIGIDA